VCVVLVGEVIVAFIHRPGASVVPPEEVADDEQGRYRLGRWAFGGPGGLSGGADR